MPKESLFEEREIYLKVRELRESLLERDLSLG